MKVTRSGLQEVKAALTQTHLKCQVGLRGEAAQEKQGDLCVQTHPKTGATRPPTWPTRLLDLHESAPDYWALFFTDASWMLSLFLSPFLPTFLRHKNSQMPGLLITWQGVRQWHRRFHNTLSWSSCPSFQPMQCNSCMVSLHSPVPFKCLLQHTAKDCGIQLVTDMYPFSFDHLKLTDSNTCSRTEWTWSK